MYLIYKASHSWRQKRFLLFIALVAETRLFPLPPPIGTKPIQLANQSSIARYSHGRQDGPGNVLGPARVSLFSIHKLT